jgi:hypothetical protein
MRDLQLLQNLVAATVKAFRYMRPPPHSAQPERRVPSSALAALMKRRMSTPASWRDDRLGRIFYFSYFE